MEKLKFIDMFAGIGGFHSGLEQAGNSVTVHLVKEIGESIMNYWKGMDK